MKNLTNKIGNGIKKAARKAAPYVAGGLLTIGGLAYSNNANAQSPEKAQEFGTAIIGGEPVKVSLSEYFGSSYLSVPTDEKDNDLGREFYPFLTYRGKNDQGKDTTNAVTWKTRNGTMEDLKSEVTYTPKQLDGKYLIRLHNKEENSTLGIEISGSEINDNSDAISGNVDYKSGEIKDVIRTVQFPGDERSFYLMYRDHKVDSAGVISGNKTPYLLVETCGDKEPIYFEGDRPYFEGKIYEFTADEGSDLEKMVDKDGKSILYAEDYIKNHKDEISTIRESDRAKENLEDKKGIPGYVKEIKEGENPCEGPSSKKEGKPIEFRAIPSAEMYLAGMKGWNGSLALQAKVADKTWAGAYGKYGNSVRELEENMPQTTSRELVYTDGQMNMHLVNESSGSENIKIYQTWEAGALLSQGLADKAEFDLGVGLVGEKSERRLRTSGEEYMEINGSKDESSVQEFGSDNTYKDKGLGTKVSFGGKIKPLAFTNIDSEILKNFYVGAKGSYTLTGLEGAENYFSGLVKSGIIIPLNKRKSNGDK